MISAALARFNRGKGAVRRVAGRAERPYDRWLIGAATTLVLLGLVMVGSASISIADRQFGQPFYFLQRQTLFVVLGLVLGYAVLRTRMVYWEKAGLALMLVALLLLVVVLIPGLGRTINGAHRWVPLGIFNLQASEPVKLFAIIFIAGYLVRHGIEVRTTWSGFIKPMMVLVILAVLLLLEPDFGATAVIMVTALGMLFLGGARLTQFGVLLVSVAAAAALLILTSPYRLQRLTGFLNPWADPFDKGFQLTQALIAFGRGDWFGVGLGASVQKLFYLPEAHTDFIFAVLAEELGLLGALVVIGLFVVLVTRTFCIALAAERAGQYFAAYLCYGIGLWIGLQTFVNLGVNMGLLPTKGLTLPLMSYGGSSVVVMCVTIALLLRVDYEVRELNRGPLAAGQARL